MRDFIDQIREKHINAVIETFNYVTEDILRLVDVIVDALKNGRKILLFGNGGSAADAQHVAAEFVNRFKLERRPLPAIALTTDTSILTAISNDYSFDEVFSKQILALCNAGDVVIGISTSGNSPNVINAIKAAKDCGAVTVAFIGGRPCRLSELADIVIAVRSDDTPRIQEVHILLFHIICELVENSLK